MNHGSEFRHNYSIGSYVLFVRFTLQEFTSVKYIPWNKIVSLMCFIAYGASNNL